MNFEEKAVDRIKRLEREVERLQVKESPGAWLDWTPTYSEAELNTTGGTFAFRYTKIGKLVNFQLRIWNCALSSAGNYIGLSLPYTATTAWTYGIGIRSSTNYIIWQADGAVLKVYGNSGFGGWTGSETAINVAIVGFYEAA